MTIPIPFNINAIPSGYDAFLVGGCVRDTLLDREPSDWDLAVSGNPAEFAAQMARNLSRRVIVMGKPGLQIHRITHGGHTIDIAPIFGKNISTDLANRDFTINALARDIKTGRFIDPAGGMEDLSKRRIRVVSQAAFINDPIRLLRAFRIAAQLEFSITDDTLQSIRQSAGTIRNSAGERIRSELLKLLSTRVSLISVRMMIQAGLLARLLPAYGDLSDCRQNNHHDFDVLAHTLNAYYYLESIVHQETDGDSCKWAGAAMKDMDDSRRALLKLSILLHDIGKPAARSIDEKGHVHFFGHAAKSAVMAADFGKRIKLSNQELEFIDTVIRSHNHPLHLFQLKGKNRFTKKAVTRFFLNAKDRTPDILIHAIADHLGKKKDPGPHFVRFAGELIHRYFSDHLEKLKTSPLITGNDLMNIYGIPPSPLYSTILDHIEEQRLCGQLTSRTAALSWAASFLADRSDSNS